MKRISKILLSFGIFIALLINIAIAQPVENDPPAPDETDNPVTDAIPIDNGLVFLLAAGTILGAVWLNKKSKSAINQ